nr:MAG TPA: hypothetical protein [Bacteriophage sp.]
MFKKLFYFIVGLLLVSCSESESPEFTGQVSNVQFESLVFQTRVALSNGAWKWEQNDGFRLSYGSSKTADFIYLSSGKFGATSLIKKSDHYYGYYPSKNISSVSGAKFTVTLPTVQETNKGDLIGDSYPFSSESTTYESIAFKGLLGVLDLSLKGLNKDLESIEVKSSTHLCGQAVVDASKNSITISGTESLKVKAEISKSAKDPHVMIVLPSGSLILNLTLKAKDGETLTKKVITSIQRSAITSSSVKAEFTSNSKVSENIILLNEGNWQSDNGQVSFIKDHVITNQWFKNINGTKIGDTPEDVLYIPNKNIVAVSVNWSNIVYFMTSNGRLIASTENVPNCRALATDGQYLYITSYAHEAADGNTYEGGYVAKIDLNTYQVVQSYGVGYEPEGIAYYNGKLYVANTGGYAFNESHGYEHSVSVIDVNTGSRKDVEIIDSDGNPVINLYGEMSQSGPYLIINSPGDYNSVKPATVIYDCRDDSYFVTQNIPCTYNTVTTDGNFFAVGSYYSYNTNKYEYFIRTIDPRTEEITEGYKVGNNVSNTVKSVIENMQNPYCCYINPYSGHLYVTDAKSYASAGQVWEFLSDGSQVGEPMDCYINPGHMCAIPDNAYLSTRAFSKGAIKIAKKKLNPNRHVSINEFYQRQRIK